MSQERLNESDEFGSYIKLKDLDLLLQNSNISSVYKLYRKLISNDTSSGLCFSKLLTIGRKLSQRTQLKLESIFTKIAKGKDCSVSFIGFVELLREISSLEEKSILDLLTNLLLPSI